MSSRSGQELKAWVRTRLPALNAAAESSDLLKRQEAREQLLSEGCRLSRALMHEASGLDISEFNCVGMIYSSLFKHHVDGRPEEEEVWRVQPAGTEDIVALLKLASVHLQVVPRFLAGPYLVAQKEGGYATFLGDDAEHDFIKYNRGGTVQLYNGSTELVGVCHHGLRTGAAAGLLKAASFLDKTRGINDTLAEILDLASFLRFGEYFSSVWIDGDGYGKCYGVNAGDQAWPYIIDAVLGIDERKENSFESRRKYLPHEDQKAVLDAREFLGAIVGRGLLFHSLDLPAHAVISGPELAALLSGKGISRDTAQAYLAVVNSYADASDSHWRLVEKFINEPARSKGEPPRGALGMDPKWLLEFYEARRNKARGARALREMLQPQSMERPSDQPPYTPAPGPGTSDSK